VGSGTVLIECARCGYKVLGAEINPAAAIMARTYEFTALSTLERRSIIERIDELLESLKSPNDSGFTNRLCKKCSSLPSDYPRYLLETLIVILNLNTVKMTEKWLSKCWRKLSEMVLALPRSRSSVTLALADARRLPAKNHSIDLVITSPPYVNVFNYHQQYRASIEALGWNVLSLARSEIGANRKNRGNRFLTMIQYYLDMALVFCELGRVCRPNARGIFVVGRESKVRKTTFYNGRILRALAHDALGLRILLEQERIFQNRFGQIIREEILHFQIRPIDSNEWLEKSRKLAVKELHSARNRVPDDVISDYSDALERVGQVEPSPIVDIAAQPRLLVEGFTNNGFSHEKP
jgi:hypothetical protein